MKILISVLLFSVTVLSQTGVLGLRGIGISDQEASVVANGVEHALIKADHDVVERKDLDRILQEQGLQLSGATDRVVEVGKIAGITKAVTGHVGRSGDEWFLYLKMTDVQTGRVLSAEDVTVRGSLADLLAVTNNAVYGLLGTTGSEQARIVRSQPREVIMGTNRMVHEHHVYEHKPQTHNKPHFIPCPYCGGTGKREGQRCMFCSPNSKYKGPETKGIWMTGKWVK